MREARREVAREPLVEQAARRRRGEDFAAARGGEGADDDLRAGKGRRLADEDGDMAGRGQGAQDVVDHALVRGVAAQDGVGRVEVEDGLRAHPLAQQALAERQQQRSLAGAAEPGDELGDR